jgi:hypothetical protein
MKFACPPVALHYPSSAEAWEVLRRDVAGELRTGERGWLEAEGMCRVRTGCATLEQLRLALRCAELEAERDVNRRLRRATNSRGYVDALREVLACVEPLMRARPNMELLEAADHVVQFLAEMTCLQLEAQFQ